MKHNNWYVITGGPSSGKSTLTLELQKRGYLTEKESARKYIETQQAKGLTLEQIRTDELAFQKAVFRLKQKIHTQLNPDIVTLLDRGYHDTIAYLKYHEHGIPKFIQDTCDAIIYKKIYVLDMLPYVKDSARTEDSQTASEIHRLLIDTYTQAGYDITYVPVMTISGRADWIEKEIATRQVG